MNTHLEILFEKYNISDKQRYEIQQIYNFLPTWKKVYLVNHFDSFAQKLSQIEESIDTQRQILVDDAITHMEAVIHRISEKYKKQDIKKEIHDLKQSLK